MLKIVVLLTLFPLIQSSIQASPAVGQCLSELVTKELSVAYNYLQLSSKLGTLDAYPGFSSLMVKLSDDHSSKGHDLTKFLAQRRFKLERLIHKDGIKVSESLLKNLDARQGLLEARKDNQDAWKKVMSCHQAANTADDAHVQDYLENHFLDHHVEIEKLFSDIEHRLGDAQDSERNLITFMIDEELLNTYGDRRKKIF